MGQRRESLSKWLTKSVNVIGTVSRFSGIEGNNDLYILLTDVEIYRLGEKKNFDHIWVKNGKHWRGTQVSCRVKFKGVVKLYTNADGEIKYRIGQNRNIRRVSDG